MREGVCRGAGGGVYASFARAREAARRSHVCTYPRVLARACMGACVRVGVWACVCMQGCAFLCGEPVLAAPSEPRNLKPRNLTEDVCSNPEVPVKVVWSLYLNGSTHDAATRQREHAHNPRPRQSSKAHHSDRFVGIPCTCSTIMLAFTASVTTALYLTHYRSISASARVA